MNRSYGEFIDKVKDFNNLSQVEQVKYIAYFYTIVTSSETFTTANITKVFDDENLTKPSNISSCMLVLSGKSNGVFLKKDKIYRFERTVKKTLDEIYLDKQHIREVSETLRSLLTKVNSLEQKSFLEEAITCYEVKAYRAAIVMTWLLTMDVL